MAYTFGEVERDLERSATDGKLRSAMAALNSLQDSDRRIVLEATAQLANQLPKAGPMLAFEIIAATARRMAREETAHG